MKNKGKSVDQKFRVGGSATIGHGGTDDGALTHQHDVPLYKKQISRVPNDVSSFDQHHGNANSDPMGGGNDE